MRERINRLANGIVDYDLPRLGIEPEAIDLPVRSDEVVRVEIKLGSLNNVHLKGLAYSSNYRVRISRPSFGGMKNTLPLEVDTRYMRPGEKLEGRVNLVTNAGEHSVNYRFTIVESETGRTIGSLKTIEDFLVIAKEDPDTALRIFDYKDFVSAPFMSEPELQSLYRSFSGGSLRASAMEEFLVAAGAKEPVRLKIQADKLVINVYDTDIESSFNIVRSSWGYTGCSVESDADFIKLSKKKLEDSDFEEDICRYEFEIDRSRLKPGVNKGQIRLAGIYCDSGQEIEALLPENEDRILSERRLYHKKHLLNYMRLRLEYEYQSALRSEIVKSMLEELEKLGSYTERAEYIRLLRAECFHLAGEADQAKLNLNAVRERILSGRQEMMEEYMLLCYLEVVAAGQEQKREGLIRLIRKFMEEGRHFNLLPMLIKLDNVLIESPSARLELIRSEYDRGNRSPFLYLEYCRLLNGHNEFLHDIGRRELHALHFGIRRGLISSGLASVIAQRAKSLRIYSRLYFPLLKKLYSINREKELLEAICSLLIKTDSRSEKDHLWYKKGVESEISIAGLYEYYVYTMTLDEQGVLPEKFLMYFLHKNSLDYKGRAKLYKNIIDYQDRAAPVYAEYMKDIEEFAREQILNSRIDRALADIYAEVLSDSFADEKTAGFLPAILSAVRVSCSEKSIKAVAVIYPELNTEQVYALERGESYIPVYSEQAVILAQDSYGNRYGGVSLIKERALDMPELLELCYEYRPDNEFLRLQILNRIVSGTETGSEDISVLEAALNDERIAEAYRSKLLSKLLEYYNRGGFKEEENRSWESIRPDIIISADKSALDESERLRLCETMINMGCIKEAYNMIKSYSCTGISAESLDRLCSRMILDRLFVQENLLLHLSMKAIKEGIRDGILLDYLCEYYNGSTMDMYSLLSTAIEEHAETYDLEERLLAQMLFTGNNEYIDKTFAWYVSRKRASEIIVKAFFTVKSAGYFISGEAADDKVFEYLENAISGFAETEKVPEIYQLALTKFYSEQTQLDENRRNLASRIMESLIDKGLVFPHFKKLAGFADIPDDIMNKEYLVYHSASGRRPLLLSRLLPEEKEFKNEDIYKCYQDIFIKEKVLFQNDIWEYRIYEEENGEKRLMSEGRIEYSRSADEAESRLARLNELVIIAASDDEKLLRNKMEDYICREETAYKLFDLM